MLVSPMQNMGTGESEIQVGRPQRPRWIFRTSKGGPPKPQNRKIAVAFHPWWGMYRDVWFHFHIFFPSISVISDNAVDCRLTIVNKIYSWKGWDLFQSCTSLFEEIMIFEGRECWSNLPGYSWDLAQDSSRSSWVHFDSETCMAGQAEAEKVVRHLAVQQVQRQRETCWTHTNRLERCVLHR